MSVMGLCLQLKLMKECNCTLKSHPQKRKRCRERGECKIGKLERYKPPKSEDTERFKKAQVTYYNKKYKGTKKGKIKQWKSQLSAVRKALKKLQETSKHPGGPRCGRLKQSEEPLPTLPDADLFPENVVPARIWTPQKSSTNGTQSTSTDSKPELVPEFNRKAAREAKFRTIEFYNKTFYVRCLRCRLISKGMLKRSEEDRNMYIPMRHNKHCFLKNEIIINPATM